jgi:tetratricopeptide (TPR) repeat protein
VLLCALIFAAAIDDDPAFQEGVKLYKSVQLEEAVGRFEAALPGASSDADKARVYAWLGLVEAQLGKADAAKASFQQAVELDPTVAMPALAPADVQAVLEQARKAVKPKPPPPKVEPPPSTTGTTSPNTAAYAVGGVGAALVVGALVTFGVGVATVLGSTDPTLFQSDARAQLATGYTEYAVAGVVAAVGAGGVAAGVLLLE